MRAWPLLATLALAACGGAPAPRMVPTAPVAPRVEDEPAVPDEGPRATSAAWVEATESPSSHAADAPLDARTAKLTAACGAADAALVHVARALADAAARGTEMPDPDAIGLLLRRMGVPHTRPRVLSAKGRTPIDGDVIAPRVATLRAAHTRCGVATATAEDGASEVVVALAVDALADLAPVPVRARTGQWLTFDAKLHVPAHGARLVVLGSRGLPRTVPTSLDPKTGRTRARFALDRPGDFVVQLVVDLDEGPRPILEARVFADTTPGETVETLPAPGEREGLGASDPPAALERMIAGLRRDEAMTALRRDPKLDALAKSHAETMRTKKRAAHDVGDGDLAERFSADGGLTAKTIGENVAHARSLALAHRALFASPSHRANLLRADYTHIGIGVADAPDGSVFVCEVFAAR